MWTAGRAQSGSIFFGFLKGDFLWTFYFFGGFFVVFFCGILFLDFFVLDEFWHRNSHDFRRSCGHFLARASSEDIIFLKVRLLEGKWDIF